MKRTLSRRLLLGSLTTLTLVGCDRGNVAGSPAVSTPAPLVAAAPNTITMTLTGPASFATATCVAFTAHALSNGQPYTSAGAVNISVTGLDGGQLSLSQSDCQAGNSATAIPLNLD